LNEKFYLVLALSVGVLHEMWDYSSCGVELQWCFLDEKEGFVALVCLVLVLQ